MSDEEIPRWLIVLGVAVVAFPMLMMSLMLLVMGSMGGPMMGPADPGGLQFFAVVPLAIALVVAYGGYRALQAEGEREPDESASEPVERLRERYLAGELSEAEFERELERHLDAPEEGGTDRELEFER